jgi:hypothetical protein
MCIEAKQFVRWAIADQLIILERGLKTLRCRTSVFFRHWILAVVFCVKDDPNVRYPWPMGAVTGAVKEFHSRIRQAKNIAVLLLSIYAILQEVGKWA